MQNNESFSSYCRRKLLSDEQKTASAINPSAWLLLLSTDWIVVQINHFNTLNVRVIVYIINAAIIYYLPFDVQQYVEICRTFLISCYYIVLW